MIDRMRALPLDRLPIALLSVAVLTSCGQNSTGSSAPDAPPNVVIILADDLGYGDLACYGSSIVKSPSCDRLAREGLRFTDAHAPSAVCSPTRYSVLTGNYPWRDNRVPRHLVYNEASVFGAGEATIASMLRDHGYATACFGKWHLGAQDRTPIDWNAPLRPGPLDVGFDSYFGVINSHNQPPQVWVEGDRVVGQGQDDQLFIDANKQVTGVRQERDNTTIGKSLAQRAVTFIEENHDRPFFLYLPTCAVHFPYTPSPDFSGSELGSYGNFLDQFDWQVGQILECLDRLGLADNTLVAVTSDNGGIAPSDPETGDRVDVPRKLNEHKNYKHSVNGRLRGRKACIYEGGHRVPFLLRWPAGIAEPGREVGETVSLVDLLGTIATATGISAPPNLGRDSHALQPLFRKSTRDQFTRECTVSVSRFNAHFAIQQGPWKLILLRDPVGVCEQAPWREGRLGPSTPELFNLATDLGEYHNVYDQHPEVVQRLTALLESEEGSG